jgi:hypothetical protein
MLHDHKKISGGEETFFCCFLRLTETSVKISSPRVSINKLKRRRSSKKFQCTKAIAIITEKHLRLVPQNIIHGAVLPRVGPFGASSIKFNSLFLLFSTGSWDAGTDWM